MSKEPEEISQNQEHEEESHQKSRVGIEDLIELQQQMNATLGNLEGQHSFLRQQLSSSLESFSQQAQTLATAQQELMKEIGKFQTGGPQRAMATLFHKLFRDFLKYISQLDTLIDSFNEETETDNHWLDVLTTLRGHFESILAEWGCKPVAIRVNEDLFDPELHEAVEGEEELSGDIPENTIVKVHRRGWELQGYILQYPQVVVS